MIVFVQRRGNTMIYLAADTHGMHDLDKIRSFFDKVQQKTKVTKDDYLIILGDIGICFSSKVNKKTIRQSLQTLPITILFINGVYENAEMIKTYPSKLWNGGIVYDLGDDILHLTRGQLFTIEGKTIFTFGGGNLIDQLYCVEGGSWCQQNTLKEEFEAGMKRLLEANFKVDYILTHTVPTQLVYELNTPILLGEEVLQDYLQEIADITSFKQWFFSHGQKDMNIHDIYIGLWDHIFTLE